MIREEHLKSVRMSCRHKADSLSSKPENTYRSTDNTRTLILQPRKQAQMDMRGTVVNNV